jgi:hypothetical protein
MASSRVSGDGVADLSAFGASGVAMASAGARAGQRAQPVNASLLQHLRE